MGATELIQGCDELAVKLRRPSAPGLPRRLLLLLLLLLLRCLLWLRLEAKRRASRRHGDRPRRCLREPHDLATAFLGGAGSSSRSALDRRR